MVAVAAGDAKEARQQADTTVIDVRQQNVIKLLAGGGSTRFVSRFPR